MHSKCIVDVMDGTIFQHCLTAHAILPLISTRNDGAFCGNDGFRGEFTFLGTALA